MPKTIIVSNRLPVKLTADEGKYSFKSSEGGLATGLGSIYKEGDNIWIGWPGDIIDEDSQDKVKQALRKENLHPVYLNHD